jgi:hypothetical protein
MRLWSIHPQQLDHVALVAVWREGLLAKKVLEGKTKGYTNHPQLDRFKSAENPLNAINNYLHEIVDEADRRGYHFNRSKLVSRVNYSPIPLTNGQLDYEWQHHLRKSKIRTPQHYKKIKPENAKAHPLFTLQNGPIQPWERPSILKN